MSYDRSCEGNGDNHPGLLPQPEAENGVECEISGSETSLSPGTRARALAVLQALKRFFRILKPFHTVASRKPGCADSNKDDHA